MINKLQVKLFIIFFAVFGLNSFASTVTFPSSSSTFTENGHSFSVTGEGYIWATDYRSASYCAGCNSSYGSIILTKTSGNTFQANSLWLKAGWAGFQVTVKGYNGSTELYSTGAISISSSYSQKTLSGWTGITKIVVTAVSNGNFTIDDIDYTVENATPSNITISNSIVSDGSSSGTEVGSFTTTDSEDAGGHTYTFASGGTDNSSFTISGSTLYTAFIADKSTKSSYSIKIRTTDTGGLYYEKDFAISIMPPANIWNGSGTVFTKAESADWTQAANQDRITSTVWLTRQNDGGLFNIYSESSYTSYLSPDNTEWAFGTTANYANYTYESWEDMTFGMPEWVIIGEDLVLHIIDENIYIDINFSSWTEDGSTGGYSYTRSTNPVLPVELASFTARFDKLNEQQNYVVLNWQTATEVNNYGFEIERRSTSTGLSASWETLGFVEGAGNSNSVKLYSFKDLNLNPDHNLTPVYRLKQIDLDGKFTYSKEIEVNVENVLSEFSLEQNYPNPFNPSTMIKYQLPMNSDVTLKIYDLLGKEVATLVNETKPAGNYEVKFDGSNLASGIYLYKLEAGDFVSIKKLVLLK